MGVAQNRLFVQKRRGDGISKHNGWTTADEIDFLNGLGTHTERGMATIQTRLARICKIKAYIESMKTRREWGNVDPEAVRKHAEEMMRELMPEVK
jgi:hypothetical protein